MPLSGKHQHDTTLLLYFFLPLYFFFLKFPPSILTLTLLLSCSHCMHHPPGSDPLIMPPAGSTRWCPTPEQLMILEEMYRNGVRTPNASQIQQITAHLSYYGKIEGKNVFYWFQNHKARERQKLRRKLGKQLQLQQQQQILQHHHHQLKHCQVPNHPQQLIHCFQSPPPGTSSPSFYNSATVLPQGGLTEDASSKMMNSTWKLGIQESVEMEKSLMGMYGHDWMMLVDHVAPPSLQPCCSKPPLKTLELFPITATNLKEECNNSSKQN